MYLSFLHFHQLEVSNFFAVQDHESEIVCYAICWVGNFQYAESGIEGSWELSKGTSGAEQQLLVHLQPPRLVELVLMFGLGFGFRVSSRGFWASGFGLWVSGFGFRVSGFGFRVSGFRFRVSGFGFGDSQVSV